VVINMARYVEIKNGKVFNVVEATAEVAAERNLLPLPENSLVQIGWDYDGTGENTFLEPPRNIEAEWLEIRATRDSKLIKSDVFVLPDRFETMSLETREAWTNYRQVLRDIPQLYDDPKTVVWPEIPE
jgi:hypothetical protein